MIKNVINKIRGRKYTNNYEGNLYFINAGIYKGDYFVCVEQVEKEYVMYNLTKDAEGIQCFSVPVDVLESGVKNKIVDFVERLPYDIYLDCKEHYLKNENSNPRLQ